jgi:uracil-DNA glycosylase
MSAEPHVPADADLDELRAAAAKCRGCDLYRDATQTVFGAGPPAARLVLVGEVPGDQEDREGEPFVGPAGRLLDRLLDEAGIDRTEVYLTNAVKHFKFTRPERGKRRIHKTPSRTEIVACRPWLDAELDLLRPDLVVALGAVAAKSLLGQDFRVTKDRGKLLKLPDGSVQVLATVHPSSVLRSKEREKAYQEMLADLTSAARALRT